MGIVVPVLALALLATIRLESDGDPCLNIRAAVASGDKAKLLGLFAHPEYAAYMREMLSRKGLEAMQVSYAPCPPGWKDYGPYVVIFHRFNQLEDDHDPLYGTIPLKDGEVALGKELPEDGGPQQVRHLTTDVHLYPDQHRMTAVSTITIDPGRSGRAPLVRLGDPFVVTNVPGWRLLDADSGVVHPKEGDVVRLGSLLIPWTTKPVRRLTVEYGATLNLKAEGKVAKGIVDIDQVEPTYAYLNSYWSPQIGRNPHTGSVRIVAPAAWVSKSEGEIVPADGRDWPTPPAVGPGEAVTGYRNDIPISNPKIVAGAYKVSAEIHRNGKRFRVYELEPLDPANAQKALAEVAAAEGVYASRLAQFPYSGYDLFQAAKDHYGIESYSYTLEPRTGYHFATHEMAHTYFGGMGACTYIHDSWNEGLGVYLDDIVFKKNVRALQGGLRSIRYPKPLSQMYFEWGDGSSSYSRGAYVMAMLDSEVGQDRVLAGLASMLKDRLGKDTRWRDIRPYIERASGTRLDWFWAQWVDGGVFPKIEIASASTALAGAGYRTKIVLRQSGTPKPYRLRFRVTLSGEGKDDSQLVELRHVDQTVELTTPFRPSKASLDLLGLTLGTPGDPVDIR